MTPSKLHRPVQFLLAVCLLTPLPAVAQEIPAARDVVSPTAYTSFDPVARGHEMKLAVVLKIRDGYHINARHPTFDYLIPTDLKIEAPTGFHAGEVVYPQGKLKTFAFSKEQALNVYQGTVILRLPVTISADARTGEQHIPMRLRYQACSQEVCLPPVALTLAATFRVVGSAAEARASHGKLFSGRP